MDQNAHGRRPHYHRGRRGQDRRGGERRTPPPHQPQQDATPREPREHVDIEQIMREIRSRISKGSGVDLTNQQIQELAARRLEAILDPRTVKPALLDQLRRGAAAAELPQTQPPAAIAVSDADVSASFFQRLFKPFSVTLSAILRAFKAQDTINREAAEREAAANRRQAEWNALQYELLQKLVTETARVSIEMQSLTQRVESLSTKVDFNERRVRGLETAPPARQPARQEHQPREPREQREFREPREPREHAPQVPVPAGADPAIQAQAPSPSGEGQPDGTRRRRRRRRGRRSGSGPAAPGFAAVAGDAPLPGESDLDGDADLDADEPTDDEPVPMSESAAAPDAPYVPVPSTFVPPEPDPLPVAGAPAWSPAPAAAPARQPEPAAEQIMPPRDEALPTAAPAATPGPDDQGPPDR